MADIPFTQRVVAVLWPSFIVAGVATVIFFTAFDPQVMMQAGGYGEISRLGGYTIGFFLFWLITASACLFTCYFQRPCEPGRPGDKEQQSQPG